MASALLLYLGGLSALVQLDLTLVSGCFERRETQSAWFSEKVATEVTVIT